jgi:hypothetical protein
MLITILLVSCSPAFGWHRSQMQNQPPPATPRNSGDRSGPDNQPPLPDEMRSRMEIERQEKEYQKLVDSANQLSDLSDSVAKAYKERPVLTAEEVKKLASIEKLARHILTESGGEEVSEKTGEEGPVSVAEAIDKLTATAADVKKCVNTQTRFVVSANVIANSNDLIHLAQYIRRKQK